MLIASLYPRIIKSDSSESPNFKVLQPKLETSVLWLVKNYIDSQTIQANVSGVTELPLNWKLLPKLWKPDTFFVNGKKSKLHKITVRYLFSDLKALLRALLEPPQLIV